MSLDLTLFYAPLSCASVPLMALIEARAEFMLRPVNLAAQQNRSPEFERLNPKRKVPVLVAGTDTLTENVAILLWISDQFAPAKLLPRPGADAYKALAHLAWCSSTIHPALTPNARPERYCDLPGSEDSVRRCARRLLAEHFALGEAALQDREWFFADHYTSADAYYYWCLRRAQQLGFDATEFPFSCAHLKRMEQRASTQRFLAIERQVMDAATSASPEPAGAGLHIRPADTTHWRENPRPVQ